MLQGRLEICLLPDFLEKRQANLGVAERSIYRPEHATAFFLPLRCSQARRQKAECSARALEVRNCSPLLSHHIDQCRVKGICVADALPQGKAFFFRLSFLSSTFGIAALHLRNDSLVCVCSGGSFFGCGNAC